MKLIQWGFHNNCPLWTGRWTVI